MAETAAAVNPYIAFRARYSIELGGEEAPLRFVREVLKAEPDKWQVEFLLAYGRGERQMSACTGHGVGKTAGEAWIIVHHAVTRYPQKTAATAATSSQLFDVLYPETISWLRKCPAWIFELWEIKSDRIELKADPENSFVSFRTSRPEVPEALAGIHCDAGWVLLVGDEGSGIPEPIFESASGSLSGKRVTFIVCGNPVRTSGLFYDIHNKAEMADYWWRIQISCLDSPRCDPKFAEEMARRYGAESNAYRIRVLGLFPKTDTDTVIPRDLPIAATTRDIRTAPTMQTVWGLDIARFGGDRTVLIKRRGNKVLPGILKWVDLDTMQVASMVKLEWDITPPSERPVEILVDVIGLGAGVVDRLRVLQLPVFGINVSEASPLQSDLYLNLRAELWFKAKEWFAKLDCWIPEDMDLIEELAVVKYKFAERSSKIQIESKKDIKKSKTLKGASPDYADAFVLTFASTASALFHGSDGHAVGWNTVIKRGIKGIP